MDVEHDNPPASQLESREPSVEDLVDLCRDLNGLGARYLVIGGFALRAAGYDRHTMDVDLLIEATPGNEQRVFAALAKLPDQAALELQPGDVARYGVVRVADEIVVDLMSSASGIEYNEACTDVLIREISGVRIPFASPRLLFRMKRSSVRDKDAADIHFLRMLLTRAGETLD